MFDVADIKKARHYSKLNRFVDIDPNGELREYPLSVDIAYLQKYGVGIYLFLSFLRHMSLCFLIMSIFQIPAVYYNIVDGVNPEQENVILSFRSISWPITSVKPRLATGLTLSLTKPIGLL